MIAIATKIPSRNIGTVSSHLKLNFKNMKKNLSIGIVAGLLALASCTGSATVEKPKPKVRTAVQ